MATTGTTTTRTTPTRDPAPDGGSSRRWSSLAVAGVGLVLGAVLLALAVPRTMAAWEAISAGAALQKIDDAKAPSRAELRDGIRGLEQALPWIASGRYLKDLGTLEVTQAQSTPPADPARATLLAASEKHLLLGLAASPADGMAWYRLAQVRQLRGDAGRPVAVALMQSLDMAPNMRALWQGRTLGLIAYRRFLGPDERVAAMSHLRTIWRVDAALRRSLLETFRADPAALAAIEQALAEDSEASSDYEKLKVELGLPAIKP